VAGTGASRQLTLKRSLSNFCPQAIGVDIQKAEIEITRTLLSILCDEITKDFGWREGIFNLAWYAAENFMKHLEAVDLVQIGEGDRKDITRLLVRIFQEEGSIKRFLHAARWPSWGEYNGFLNTWLVTNRYSQLVRSWFEFAVDEWEHTANESLEEAQYDWMRRAAGSVKELLRPLMMVAAGWWLRTNGADDNGHLRRSPLGEVWLLHAYFLLVCTLSPSSNFLLYIDWLLQE
jgi:hypothetical protein